MSECSTAIKKPIVFIGTPYYRGFSQQYVMSMVNTVYELSSKYQVGLVTSQGGQVHVNRNVIFKYAYDYKVPYLLFIDTDMAWLPEHVEKLVAFNKDVVTGLCTTRKKSPVSGKYHYCVYDSDGMGRCTPISRVPDVPFRCFGTGAGFLLIRRAVIVRLWDEKTKHGYPFDMIPHRLSADKSQVQSSYLGEDISFCARLRKLGIDIWCHPDVRPGHVGELVAGAPEKEVVNNA